MIATGVFIFGMDVRGRPDNRYFPHGKEGGHATPNPLLNIEILGDFLDVARVYVQICIDNAMAEDLLRHQR